MFRRQACTLTLLHASLGISHYPTLERIWDDPAILDELTSAAAAVAETAVAHLEAVVRGGSVTRFDRNVCAEPHDAHEKPPLWLDPSESTDPALKPPLKLTVEDVASEILFSFDEYLGGSAAPRAGYPVSFLEVSSKKHRRGFLGGLKKAYKDMNQNSQAQQMMKRIERRK